MKLIVKENSVLIDYLIKNTDYTKTKLKSLNKYRNITVDNKAPINLNVNIKKGQIIEISKEKKENSIGTIPIIYEDNNYLVVYKPSGMLTIATEKEKVRTLYHKVREYTNSKQKHEKVFIVHRLDKETSGLVIFCKDEKLRDKIQENWDKIAIRREYTCVVSGTLDKKKDKLVNNLKERKDNTVYISNEGKKAITNYEVIKEKDNSLLKILIETGRKNQIRVQLANINHPILGDKKYGARKEKKLLLCANRLDIKDITTNKVLSFEVNIPSEYFNNLDINKTKKI